MNWQTSTLKPTSRSVNTKDFNNVPIEEDETGIIKIPTKEEEITNSPKRKKEEFSKNMF